MRLKGESKWEKERHGFISTGQSKVNIILESDRVNICALAADINIESKSMKTLVNMFNLEFLKTPCVEDQVFSVVYIHYTLYTQGVCI